MIMVGVMLLAGGWPHARRKVGGAWSAALRLCGFCRLVSAPGLHWRFVSVFEHNDSHHVGCP